MPDSAGYSSGAVYLTRSMFIWIDNGKMSVAPGFVKKLQHNLYAFRLQLLVQGINFFDLDRKVKASTVESPSLSFVIINE